MKAYNGLPIQDGFQDDSLRIIRDIRKSQRQAQVLLFSATFDENVKNFVSKVVHDYNQLFVKKEELSLESVKQYKVYCPDEMSKILVIKDRILELGEKVGQIIIFVNSKKSAAMLHTSLVELGYEVTTIHGALTHEDRDKIVKEFKDNLTKVLISTDVLARGFDQQRVNLVINFDLPIKYGGPLEPHFEVYLHRIGRAGRFGRKGAVFNLIMNDNDRMLMEKIERYFDSPVIEVTIKDEKLANCDFMIGQSDLAVAVSNCIMLLFNGRFHLGRAKRTSQQLSSLPACCDLDCSLLL
ncbi:DEAD-box ATP-dependent RNA helicase 38 [Linum perenne]